jgi:flagellar biogenesis protein FliO
MALLLWSARAFARAALGSRLRLGSRPKVVNVMETTLLPNAAALHVVKVARRYYLLGRSGAQLTALCEIEAAAFDEPCAS